MNILGNLKKGVAFVVSAPAGTGKTTLVRMLVEEFSAAVNESVSCTTRAPRTGEIAERDYHFLSKKEFEKKIQEGEFLEYAEVFGQFYGTSKSEVLKKQNAGKHVVLVIDTQGALKLKNDHFPAVFIFIKPPSLIALRERLFNRKTEADQLIEERLAWAEHEIEMAIHYDYQIVNDTLNHAYDVLRSIFIAEEHKTKNIK
jgi:guanylate kinase